MYKRTESYSPLPRNITDRILERWKAYKAQKGGLEGEIYLELGLNKDDSLSQDEKTEIVKEYQEENKHA